MNVRVVRRRFDLLLGDVAEIVAVRDVVANASIEENGLLTDETQLATKQLQIPLANVFIISKLRPYVYSYHTLKNTFSRLYHGSFFRIVESLEKLNARAFTGSARADKCDRFAGFHHQRQVLQHRCVGSRGIAKIDVFKSNTATEVVLSKKNIYSRFYYA